MRVNTCTVEVKKNGYFPRRNRSFLVNSLIFDSDANGLFQEKFSRAHMYTHKDRGTYLFTLSDDLELQLEGSFRGSRDPLLVTELKDFEEVGPECHPLGVRLLST